MSLIIKYLFFFFFLFTFLVYSRIQHLQKQKEKTMHINTLGGLLRKWKDDQSGLEYPRMALRRKEIKLEQP